MKRSNIVQEFNYLVLIHTSADYQNCENEELKVPVEYIRWDYPVITDDTRKGRLHVHELDKAVTKLYDLFCEIRKHLKQDYDNGICSSIHAFEDYCIEQIEIHPNNLATIYIGS